ncbi:hypothetical protein [Natrinema salinisoli]|uniref:hypothetical protein n=1 Tax=Natrinema salinisoli TaxID=2878535 RepID=UPI001CF02845|nr:hypothetical protein [Natrinema salinisoli]
MSESAFRKNIVTDREKDYSEYPIREYDVLKGFKTWKPSDAFALDHNPDKQNLTKIIESHEDYRTGPIGYNYNVERFGLAYGTSQSEFFRFWSAVSKCTEPFVVWHSSIEHEFQRIDAMDRDGDDEATLYRVECRDGEVTLYEVTFERTEEEKIGGFEPVTEGDIAE